MKAAGLELSANLSILFPETPLLERAGRARAAGFTSVESWWPFGTPDPGERAVTDFLESLDVAGVRLTALDAYAGDFAAGDLGVAADRGRHDELFASLPSLVRIGQATGCKNFHCLYGMYDRTRDRADQDAAALDAFVRVAAVVEPIGGTMLLEPIFFGTENPYPLDSVEKALTIIDEDLAARGVSNGGLLFDLFHIGLLTGDLLGSTAKWAHRVRSVQIADSPGHAEPGTGTLPLAEALHELARLGYSGAVGCEYEPLDSFESGLDWITKIDD